MHDHESLKALILKLCLNYKSFGSMAFRTRQKYQMETEQYQQKYQVNLKWNAELASSKQKYQVQLKWNAVVAVKYQVQMH